MFDDVPALPVAADHRHEGTNAVDHALHVDADHPFPFFQRHVLYRGTVHRDAGVVHRNMQCAKSIERSLAGRFDRVRIGHVDGYPDRANADRFDRLSAASSGSGRTSRKHDVGAGMGERLGDSKSDTGRRPRYDGGFPPDLTHVWIALSARSRGVAISARFAYSMLFP